MAEALREQLKRMMGSITKSRSLATEFEIFFRGLTELIGDAEDQLLTAMTEGKKLREKNAELEKKFKERNEGSDAIACALRYLEANVPDLELRTNIIHLTELIESGTGALSADTLILKLNAGSGVYST